jgi:hypothetical protein
MKSAVLFAGHETATTVLRITHAFRIAARRIVLFLLNCQSRLTPGRTMTLPGFWADET